MTPTFAPLPVALPLGCHGARVDVATVAPLVAAMPAGDWPEAMRDAADSRRADFLAGRLAAREAVLAATGRAPVTPARALSLADRPERFEPIAADAGKVADYVRVFAGG